MPDPITSLANPTVKRIRALGQRKHRRREGAFVVEGLQPVWRAVTSDWVVDTLLVAPELLANADARRMVDDERARGTRVVDVSADVFRRLSDRDGPAGLLAVVRGSLPHLADFRAGDADRPVVALHRVGNPGNIGTIMRTVDAVGGAGLVLIGPCADPLAPPAIKASMGSVFAVPLACAQSPDELFGWAESAGRPTVAVTGHADRSLWQAAIAPASVLLLGSEGEGLPDELVARCASAVAIPMEGTVESLNLATATSVVLYEIRRRAARDSEVHRP